MKAWSKATTSATTVRPLGCTGSAADAMLSEKISARSARRVSGSSLRVFIAGLVSVGSEEEWEFLTTCVTAPNEALRDGVQDPAKYFLSARPKCNGRVAMSKRERLSGSDITEVFFP
jgi:mevalonate pyrophosphate decarboxylase